jgi:hypothetical protein
MSTAADRVEPDETIARLDRLAALEAEVAALEATAVTKARTDFVAFCEFVLKDEATGQPIQLHALQKSWIRHIQVCWSRGLVPWILAPFGSGKSSCLVIMMALYALGNDPRLRIKIVSANDDIAKERLAVIRQYIESSAEYALLFPDVVAMATSTEAGKEKRWTKKAITLARGTLAKDASVQAIGATSSAQGGRADLLIFDDMNDLRNTIIYPRLREQVWKNYTFLLSRLEANGRAVGVMTRWHADDLFGRITKDPDMANGYGFLVQSVSDDLQSIECEVLLGAGKGAKPTQRSRFEQLVELWDTGALEGV